MDFTKNPTAELSDETEKLLTSDWWNLCPLQTTKVHESNSRIWLESVFNMKYWQTDAQSEQKQQKKSCFYYIYCNFRWIFVHSKQMKHHVRNTNHWRALVKGSVCCFFYHHISCEDSNQHVNTFLLLYSLSSELFAIYLVYIYIYINI